MGETGRVLPLGTVTLLFTDIEGSTALLHALGDDYGALLAGHNTLLAAVWNAHRGVVVDAEGDAFFVAFERATDAVEAAVEAQRRLADTIWPAGHEVRVRMGLHTGEPQQQDGAYIGTDVHYAARLAAAAHGKQVLLSATTRSLIADRPVADLGSHALKDFPATRPLFQLILDGVGPEGFPPPRTADPASTNLPAPRTPLVGRGRESREVRGRLLDTAVRVTTLIGAGGAGKTRLAVSCAHDLLTDFPDGVVFVPLAPLTDPAGVGVAIAAALRAPGRAELGGEPAAALYLSGRAVLLVVDNAEHLLDAVGLVLGRLLDAAPLLKALVTSQAPLRIAGESLVTVESLELPEAAVDLAVLAAVPAVALFCERAAAADATFALGPANAADVAELCRRLDGLPLALELAAARVRMAGVRGLLEAISQDLDRVGRGGRDLPERQRGLRAALEWTVSLLDEPTRRALRGVVVFADAWSLEQVGQLLGQDVDVWEAMASLVDFSLVRRQLDGRYTMAQRVRVHAAEMLAQSGEEREMRHRHADLVIAEVARLAADQLMDFSGVQTRIGEIVGDIEVVLSSRAGDDVDLRSRLLSYLGMPYFFSGRLPPLAAGILALDTGPTNPLAAAVLVSQAAVHMLTGFASAGGEACLARAVQLERSAGGEALLRALCLHALVLARSERPDEARIALAEAGGLAAGLEQRFRDAVAGLYAFVAFAEGDLDAVRRILDLIGERPDRTDFAAMSADSLAGLVAMERGDYRNALASLISSLKGIGTTQSVNAMGELFNIGDALAGLGRVSEAAEAIGAAERVQRDFGFESISIDLDPVILDAQSAVGAQEWERAKSRGAARDLTQAVAWATQLPSGSSGPAR